MENMLGSAQKPRVVTVFSSKSGTGKTTIAALLAWKLAEQGESVLIVDLDGQSNISRLFEVEKPPSTIADLFPKEGGSPAKALDEVIVPAGCDNVWIAPSDRSLLNLDATDIPETMLRDAILGMERMFDCIVIDCPPTTGSLNAGAIRAIEAGNEKSTVVVPTRATATDMVAAAMDLKMIRRGDPADLFSLAKTLCFVEEVLDGSEGQLPIAPYKVVTNRPGPVRPGGYMCGAKIPRDSELEALCFLKPKNIDYAALSEILG